VLQRKTGLSPGQLHRYAAFAEDVAEPALLENITRCVVFTLSQAVPISFEEIDLQRIIADVD